jgi:hypothetical protein
VRDQPGGETLTQAPREQSGIPGRWQHLRWLFQFAIGLIAVTGIVGFTGTRLLAMWPPEAKAEYLVRLLGVLLLCVIVLLIFRWIFAVAGEMRMLETYFRDYIPPQPGKVHMWTVLFAVLLGVMGYYADRIEVFASLFVLYNLGDLWAHALRDKQLKSVLRHIAAQPDPDQSKPRAAILQYYLDRPQVHRSATMMFFTFIALLLAQASLLCGEVAARPWLQVGAYGVIIINITISEIVIARWRRARDADLEDRYSH